MEGKIALSISILKGKLGISEDPLPPDYCGGDPSGFPPSSYTLRSYPCTGRGVREGGVSGEGEGDFLQPCPCLALTKFSLHAMMPSLEMKRNIAA